MLIESRHGKAAELYNKYLAEKRRPTADGDEELQKIYDKLVWPWRIDANKMRNGTLEIKISHVSQTREYCVYIPISGLFTEWRDQRTYFNIAD